MEIIHLPFPPIDEITSLIKDTGQWDDLLTDDVFEHVITNGLVYEIVLEGAVIGYLLFSNYHPCIAVEESLYIKPEFQGKWCTKSNLRAVRDVMTHVAFDKLKVERLVGIVQEDNTRSRRLTKSVGFKEEGTLRNIKMIDGELTNVVVYCMLKEER